MSGIRLVLLGVATVLTVVVHLVLFNIGFVDIVGAHSEDLGNRDEEVEEVDHLDFGVLLVKLLDPLSLEINGVAGGALGKICRKSAE